MFMTFMMCDNQGRPQGQRVCINLKEIMNIMEQGTWAATPEPTFRGFEDEDADNPRRPLRRPTRRDRTPDAFISIPNCVGIQTIHNNYTVVANFDELTKTLESLSSLFER